MSLHPTAARGRTLQARDARQDRRRLRCHGSKGCTGAQADVLLPPPDTHTLPPLHTPPPCTRRTAAAQGLHLPRKDGRMSLQREAATCGWMSGSLSGSAPFLQRTSDVTCLGPTELPAEALPLHRLQRVTAAGIGAVSAQ